MRILATGQVENDTHILGEIAKQTIQPTDIAIHVDEAPAKGIKERRQRIADNHQILTEIVQSYKADIIWQVEGDSVLPEDCLERLLKHHKRMNNVIISGVQVGRHGLYCLGAWHINDDRSLMASADYNDHGLKEVSAMGMYCFIAPKNVWLEGVCAWDGEHWGPDVNYFLSIDTPKFCDMDLHIGHKTKHGIINVTDMSTCNATFYKDDERWKLIQE